MKVTARTRLPHPPEVVFDFVADMHNDESWVPMVRSVEQIEGDGPGAGAKYRYIQQMGRHEVPMESTIVAFERPRLLRWHIDHKALDYEATMRFQPDGGGCRIMQTNHETWHFAPWHLKILGPFLVRRQMRRQLALLAQALAKAREGDIG